MFNPNMPKILAFTIALTFSTFNTNQSIKACTNEALFKNKKLV